MRDIAVLIAFMLMAVITGALVVYHPSLWMHSLFYFCIGGAIGVLLRKLTS